MQNKKAQKELFLFEPKTFLIIIITSVLTLAFAFFKDQGFKFLTSVLSPVPAHEAYNGTVFPIQKVPNWVKLTETERKMTYNELTPDKFIATPAYNPSRLVLPISSLKWNDAGDDMVRNEKITYSTPYLGSYKLDGLEGGGSHPAVDIKVPIGTPVYAMANGTVIKVDNGNGGFGKHVVLQHNNFPSPEDPNTTTTLYSSYSHLSSISVNVYDIVKKGQLIGFSGMSGTATTPHLHFQIDNDSAPWHPYWPFSGAEQRAAGYSFFEAINNGLGKNNAIADTVNPLIYVQKNLGDQTLVVSAQPEVVEAMAVHTDGYENTSFAVQIIGGTQFEEGKTVQVAIQAFDEKGNLLNAPSFSDEVVVSLMNANGKLSINKLTNAQLKSGISDAISVTDTKIGKEKVLVRFRDHEFSSPEYTVVPISPVVIPEKPVVAALETPPLAEGVVPTAPAEPDVPRVPEVPVVSETPATPETPVVPPSIPVAEPEVPVTVATSTTPIATPEIPAVLPAVPELTKTEVQAVPTELVPVMPFVDIKPDSPYLEALNYLKPIGLVKGYGDGTFQPDREVSRAEAVTFILRAIDEKLKNEVKKLFPDVSLEAWYASYIFSAFENGFVKGYPDGTFKPDLTVNLSEFFKMLFLAERLDLDPTITTTLPEGVIATEWYAPYLQEAIRQNIVEVKENKLNPDQLLTRGEIAKILFRLKTVEASQAE